MKHIKQDISLKAWFLSPGWTKGVGVKSKIQFFFRIWSCCISNLRERCIQQHGSKYFAHRYTLDLKVVLDIKLAGMECGASFKKYFVLTHTLDPWGGFKRSNIFESGNVAYQIERKEV